MKREIIFRVWHNNEMYNLFDAKGKIIIRNGGYVILEHPSALPFFSGDLTALEGAILMQYTGMKDKNYKKIFEGDIVKVETIHGETFNAPIVFWHGTYCVKRNEEYFTLIHVDIEYDWEQYRPFYEVVGNIYENPQLITKNT